MKTHCHTLRFKTKKFMDFIDITDEIKNLIKKRKIKDGLVTIFSKHTTAAVRINEKEKGIFKDFKIIVQTLFPPKKYYHHNDLSIRTENLVCEVGASDCINGHSHCLHLLMGATSEFIPIMNKELTLGTYQRIFLIELDCARRREVLVQIIAED